MNKSKIEWCSYTWNPITGCYHDCEYCYAKGIAIRFGGMHVKDGDRTDSFGGRNYLCDCKGIHVLDERVKIKQNGRTTGRGVHLNDAPFPFGFEPTLHRYRLDAPAKVKIPQTIFVGGMADVFGDWVPDEWITEIFKACEAAPWHRYLFLTKNPKRYTQDKIHNYGQIGTNSLHHKYPDNWWFGTTITNQKDLDRINHLPFYKNCYLSIEPLQEDLQLNSKALRNTKYVKWVIVGAETGNRKGKIIPKREWIENIVNACKAAEVPVFLKNNLKDIWESCSGCGPSNNKACYGECRILIQEFPWGGDAT